MPTSNPVKAPYFLLVEDSADEIAMLFKILDQIDTSLEVSVCHDGAEALDALATAVNCAPSGLPHFVLLDINMPLVDGFEVLQQARAIPALEALPIVMFSTSSRQEDVDRAFECGSTAYCVKPMHFDDYVGVVKSILARWGGQIMHGAQRAEAMFVDQYFRSPGNELGS
jgi:two-component system response regulator